MKANNALGFVYEEGRGVPQNFELAGRLYLQVMKKGDADSMVNRGLLLDKGRGVIADSVNAYMHVSWSVAYAPDQETREAAVKMRGDIAAKLSKPQITKGQALADKFAKEQIK